MDMVIVSRVLIIGFGPSDCGESTLGVRIVTYLQANLPRHLAYTLIATERLHRNLADLIFHAPAVIFIRACPAELSEEDVSVEQVSPVSDNTEPYNPARLLFDTNQIYGYVPPTICLTLKDSLAFGSDSQAMSHLLSLISEHAHHATEKAFARN